MNISQRESSLLITTSSSGDEEEEFVPIMSMYTRRIIIYINYCILGATIGMAGTIANIINIIVFIKIGFKDTINISLLGLAISDFFCLVTFQWLFLCFNPFFRYSDIPFDSFEIQYLTAGWPHVASARITGFITAYITFERCLCVTIPLKVKEILTPTKTVCVLVTIYVSMIASVMPIYSVTGLGYRFYETLNRSLIGLVFLDKSAEVTPIIFSLTNGYGYVAFISVITCSVILIKKLKSKTKWREEATSTGARQPSNSTKERRAVVMVTMISSIFIACFFPTTAIFLITTFIDGFSVVGKYQNIHHAVLSFGFLLEAVNSTVNILVYVKMSTNYRTAFNELFRIKKKE